MHGKVLTDSGFAKTAILDTCHSSCLAVKFIKLLMVMFVLFCDLYEEYTPVAGVHDG